MDVFIVQFLNFSLYREIIVAGDNVVFKQLLISRQTVATVILSTFSHKRYSSL
jgi:hypothetical protein